MFSFTILIVVVVCVETGLHFFGINTLDDSITALPSGVAVGAHGLSFLDLVSTRTALMIQCATITGILDAAVVFPFLCEIHLCFSKQTLDLMDLLSGG